MQILGSIHCFLEQFKKSVPQEFSLYLISRQHSTSSIAHIALLVWSPEGTANVLNSAQWFQMTSEFSCGSLLVRPCMTSNSTVLKVASIISPSFSLTFTYNKYTLLFTIQTFSSVQNCQLVFVPGLNFVSGFQAHFNILSFQSYSIVHLPSGETGSDSHSQFSLIPLCSRPRSSHNTVLSAGPLGTWTICR